MQTNGKMSSEPFKVIDNGVEEGVAFRAPKAVPLDPEVRDEDEPDE